MAIWDGNANDIDVGFKVLYYCMICEDFFQLSPIAPLRCPICLCDARYILGPITAKEYDLNKMIQERKKKYPGKMGR